MGREKDISVEKRHEIKGILEGQGHSQREIAKMVGVSQKTVGRISMQIKEGKDLMPKREGRSGRKRITTPRAERKIQKIVLNNRKKSLQAIAKDIRDQVIILSDRTVRRRLQETGFKCRRPA